MGPTSAEIEKINYQTHDKLNQEIHSGDCVLSGQRLGDSGHMAIGVMKNATTHTRVSLTLNQGTWEAGRVGKIKD